MVAGYFCSYVVVRALKALEFQESDFKALTLVFGP